MGWFGGDSDEAQAYDQFGNTPHKAEVSHELIGGAAAYEAMKAYENHCEANGKPQSHAEAKELMAGVIGAFVDREVETKGLDFVDRERAKHNAKERVNQQLEQEYNY